MNLRYYNRLYERLAKQFMNNALNNHAIEIM